MTFYRQCFGGELRFQTIGESPLSERMPKKMRNCILHSTLISGSIVLTGTDITPESGLVRGNAVSLALHCSSAKEIKDCYRKLSSGGRAEHPLEDTFWGTLFGDLTDKFGNHWLLNYIK